MFLSYDQEDDASSDDFTLAASGIELLATDLKYALDTVALHSEELSISLIADVAVKRYAGFNDRFPYKFVYTGWRTEGRFTRPIPVASDSLSKDYLVDGGETSIPAGEHYNNLNLVIHPAGLAYDGAVSSDGEIRIETNIILDTAIPGGEDEIKEEVSFKGAYDEDGANPLFEVKQGTLLTQPWAG